MHTANLSDILEAYVQDKITEQSYDHMTRASMRCDASDYVDFDSAQVPIYFS